MMEEKRTFSFENIQCIKKASDIVIYDKRVNILYGFNGLGKSSLGKALNIFNNDFPDKAERINALRPFGSDEDPKIATPDKPYKKCIMFDRDFISENLMKKKGEVIANAERVFFSNKKINEEKEEIEKAFKAIKAQLAEINMAIVSNSLINSTLSKNISTKGVRKSSAIDDGMRSGLTPKSAYEDDVVNLFKEFFELPNPNAWVSWHNQGALKPEWKAIDKCPYCGQEIPYENKEIINNVFAVKEGKNGDTFVKAQELFVELKKYVSEADEKFIEKLMRGEYSEDEIDTIEKKLFLMISPIKEESEKLKNLTAFDYVKELDDIKEDKLLETISNCKLDRRFFENIRDEKVNIDECLKTVDKINVLIDGIIANIKPFYQSIYNYNQMIANAISTSQNEINEYLKVAGIPYQFVIDNSKKELKTYIHPLKSDDNVDPNKNFSYGEQNSFAMALFGAICKSDDCDLVILDDPISSFDQNKKYAVLNFLLNKFSGMLAGKTVVILTHDQETLIDLVVVKGVTLENTAKGFLLDKNGDGEVTEEEIDEDIVIPLFENEMALAHSSAKDHPLISRLVHYRRYKELSVSGFEYTKEYAMVSKLLKLEPTESMKYRKHDGTKKVFTDEEIVETEKIIQQDLNDFSVKKFKEKYYNIDDLINEYSGCKDYYDKAVMLRAMLNKCDGYHPDRVALFFFKEAYHYQNEPVSVFKQREAVPPYMLQLCEDAFNNLVAFVNSKKPEK